MLQDGRSEDLLELVVNLLRQMKLDNDRLQIRLARLLEEKFGRRSEKIPIEQLRLFLEELGRPDEAAAVPAEMPQTDTVIPPVKRAAAKRGRKPLPASLPREEVVIEPSEEQLVCAECGKTKGRIGEDRSEVLEFVPASFKVIVYARSKYACRGCEGGVVIAPVASKPIESGIPGFGLMADVLVKKYADHTPLHRMRQIYLRSGVDLAVSSLSNWVMAGAAALEPIAQAIRKKMLESHLVALDDTGLCVLDDKKKGGSKRGYMWAYLGDQRWVVYAYTETRSSEGPFEFLKDRHGWIQADAYSGHDCLFKGPAATAIEVACWAHARRYFVKALPNDKRAAVAIHYIGQLYAIEREATEAGLDHTARLAMRQERSRPVIEAIGEWIKQTIPAAVPKSPLGEALVYALNQWTPLLRFLEDGRLPLDNNACERALRHIAIGRKNWMFAGSDEGARRAAVIYTVFGTCRLHGIDPWGYVNDVLRKLSDGWLQSRIEELLPPNWLASQTTKDSQACAPDSEPTADLGPLAANN